MARFSEAERKRIGRLVRSSADALGCRDWTFTIAWDEPPAHNGAYAACAPVEGRRLAVLRFCDDFGKLPVEEQRLVIAHEVIHAYFAELDEHFEGLSPYFSPREYEHLHRGFVQRVERIVDGLATSVAPLLPEAE